MKSKYFNISENQDGTFHIATKNGRLIDMAAKEYEINPKQPKFIKVRHDGGAWCSLFNNRGCALKDTMWVNDVVLNDDGSYRIKEYIHDNKWTHYDNGVSRRYFFNRYMAYVSGIVLSGIVLTINCLGKESSARPCRSETIIKQGNENPKKITSSVVEMPVVQAEHIHE